MQTLSTLKVEKIKLESEYKKIEAEVGPIKYVAELIYGSSDTKVVDKAIRFVIIMLIFVFDPLAVLLLIAFNISMKNKDDYNMEYLDMTSLIKTTVPPKVSKPRIRVKAKSDGGNF